MKPADLLLSYTRSWRSLVIPGYWTHVAMVTGQHLVEATPPMVRISELVDFWDADHVALIRPTWMLAQERRDAAEYMTTLVGAQYDPMFRRGNEKYYCSEAVALAYVSSSVVPQAIAERMTGRLITPQDLFNSGCFDLIADSRG